MQHTRFRYAFTVAPELQHSSVAISDNQLQLMIDRDKEHAGCKLGGLIAKHIGFTEHEDRNSFNNKRYILDVVAFQFDKWWKFKIELRDFLVNTLMKDSDFDKVKGLFDKLEDPNGKK